MVKKIVIASIHSLASLPGVTEISLNYGTNEVKNGPIYLFLPAICYTRLDNPGLGK